MSFNAITYYGVFLITLTDNGALESRDLRVVSKYVSKLVCLVLICDK